MYVMLHVQCSGASTSTVPMPSFLHFRLHRTEGVSAPPSSLLSVGVHHAAFCGGLGLRKAKL